MASQEVHNLISIRSRLKNLRDAGGLETRYVFVWDNASPEYQNIIGLLIAKQFHHSAEEMHVSAGQDRKSNCVHVLLNRRSYNSLRCLA